MDEVGGRPASLGKHICTHTLIGSLNDQTSLEATGAGPVSGVESNL